MMKVLTALAAIERWGLEHRFHTDFQLGNDDRLLWVKGYGDPYLVSEELYLIADALKARGVRKGRGDRYGRRLFRSQLGDQRVLVGQQPL